MTKAFIDDEKRAQYNGAVKALGIQQIIALARTDEFKEVIPIQQFVDQLNLFTFVKEVS